MPDNATLGTAVERNMFKVYVQSLNNVFDNFEKGLKQHILKQKALGRTGKDIFKELIADKKNGRGLYKELIGKVEKSVDESLFTQFQLAGNSYKATDTKLYKWQLDPIAEHCDSCLFQDSRGELPINQFPIPGTQPTNGETNCNEYCKCQLVIGESNA